MYVDTSAHVGWGGGKGEADTSARVGWGGGEEEVNISAHWAGVG
jgi:hypothetical protein